MECVDTGGAAQFAFTARRNNSLSSSGRSLVFGFTSFISVGIGLAFTLLFGAWPILPFAGAEVLVLYWAFRHVDRHAVDCERVAIDGDRLRAVVLQGGRVNRLDANRYWTRVVYTEDGGRLALRSGGRELEIGRHLNRQQRLSVARRLERELHDPFARV